MTLLPKVKLKATVNFPATVLDGTGIDVTKSNGTYRFDLDFADFGIGTVTDQNHQNVLLWNDTTSVYTLASVFSLNSVHEAPNDGALYGRKSLAWFAIPPASGGIPDAPNDGVQYGRQGLGWTAVATNRAPIASPVFTGDPQAPTPTAGDNDTSIATTAFVTTAAAASVVTATNFLQAGTGAVNRTMQNKARESVSVLDFGAVADGSITVSGTGTNDATAFTNAWATGQRVIVPSGNYRIATGGLIYTGNRGFVFMPGAVLCPDAGITVTFQNPVSAGCERVFGNNGTVTGIRSVRPEWWGAVHDGTTDDAPAIIKAIASVENSASSVGGEYALTFDKGVYAIASTITFTPSATIQWRIRGAGNVFGTTILAKSTFSGSIAVQLAGSAGSSLPIADWLNSSLAIVNQTQGAGPFVGLVIGSNSMTLSGYHCSVLEDIRVSGFGINYYYKNTRLVETRRCSAWPTDNSGVEAAGSTGYWITADASKFTGDLTFINSQVVGPAHNSGTPTGNGVVLTNDGNSSVIVSGIRFIGFIFYGSGTQCKLEATGSSTLSDIWFTGGTQFEGASTGLTTGLYMTASGGTSKIFDIHVNDCYMSGYGFLNQIKALTPSSGEIRNLFITGNFMSNPNGGGAAIDLRGTGGFSFAQVSILGNQVRDSAAAAGDGIYIENVSMCTVNNNALVGTSGGLTNFIKFNTGGNWLVAQGNNRNGLATNAVTNSTGAANTSIANNL